MNKKNTYFALFTIIITLIILIITKEIIPIINENNSKKRVFNEMKDKSKDVIRGIVGIIPENEEEGLTSHKGIGSGVIFDKKENTYYVITAKHVIDKDNSKFKIFTKDTKYSGQKIKANDNVEFEIPDDNYYDSLLDAKIEYISKTDDLAILSFECDGDLTVLDFENKKLSQNDKLMVIGHPEGKKYQITYGYIKSKLKKVRNDNVIEHNAYMKQGNSGGVALTENMKIAGINISGKFTLLGHYKVGYMIPYNIVKENINTYKNNIEKLNHSNEKINWKEEKVKMTVKDISKDKTEATLVIEDKNDKPASWDNNYSVQKLSEENIWYNLKSNITTETLMKIASPDENGTTIINLNWKEKYGELKNGTYRIVKNKNFKTLYSEQFIVN